MPLINYIGGSGGNSQLCEQVETLTASPGMLSAVLTWTIPSVDQNSSFVGTRIVRKEGSKPTSPNDGLVVYEGTELSYTDEGLTDGVTYYYRAFAYNSEGKYQTSERCVSLTATAGFYLSELPAGSLLLIPEKKSIETTTEGVTLTRTVYPYRNQYLSYATTYTLDQHLGFYIDASNSGTGTALVGKYIAGDAADTDGYYNTIYLVTSVTQSGSYTVTLNITATEYSITQIESSTPFYVAEHDYNTDRTLMVRRYIHSKSIWNSTVCNYDSSYIDSWLNTEYKSLLSSEIQELIGTTEIDSYEIDSTQGVTTLARSIFLLSATEIGGELYYADSEAPGEGSLLDIADSIRQATYSNGTAGAYWLRSRDIHESGTDRVFGVNASGDSPIKSVSPDTITGSRPCFTLPNDIRASVTPDENGYYSLT